MDPNLNYAITFVACFDEESNQKIAEALKLISNYRICKVPMKNGNREDIDTLPFHSTISSWDINKEQEIVEQIRRFFTFESFSADFRFAGNKTHICLEPIQEDQLRELVSKAYNLKPCERYTPSKYHLHSTININPDVNQIQEQVAILKKVTLNLRINEVKLFEIYPAKVVCSVDESGFHLHKDIDLPKEIISSEPIIIEKKKEKKFNGIINYLIDSVDVSSSSVCNDDLVTYNPLNVINKNSPFCFSSKNIENSWITFNFGNHRINPSHYEIMSSDAKKNKSHLKSWVIEGSNDDAQWNIIDENKDCIHLNNAHAIYSFNISNVERIPYQFIRLRQTGTNCRGKYYLKFKKIEFYGTIFHK